ncbi:glutamate--tRNA ligase [Desulfovibrio ferrophilus]|uniref:Glutamate--tRNA ligase n=1 Tax=Desulfovibrio ferrophilus TaxID=241368 RepID=A0A2Z6B0F7_9BACT|nr:glutamate--tRNA ligase [Desulfovibrio ferrophilus]BBD08938.1 glutamyl-tRNA synthetase [Desulfovibrio ferrophilus]
MTKVVTRFPPSPTGYLHIGGARTALFNWLFARAHDGEFVLRIEDTDQARSTPEMTQAIVDGMNWLGLDWDHGPYLQSDRTELYNQHIEKLIETGHAYYCDCTSEQVDAMREKARAEGKKPKYDESCRSKNLGPGEGRVVRFKAPEGLCAWKDLVKGPISMDYQEMVDDFIIRRGNGSPMYNLAVVVDDADMGVTHIIRGEDHLSNNPKQMALYNALGYPMPEFGHVPMIFGSDKKKLSKRHGAMSVMEYEKMGFLPEAMVNYLVRLGWGHGDQEVFSREELVELFNAKGLNSSPSMFDLTKLTSVNAHYIKEASVESLVPLLARYLKDLDLEADDAKLAEIVPLYQPRATTMVEMAEQCAFFLMDDEQIEFEEKAVKKNLKPAARELLAEVRALLATVDEFTEAALEEALHAFAEERELKFGKIAQPVRVAITGRSFSPGLYETLAVLGKDKSLNRMDRALALPQD